MLSLEFFLKANTMNPVCSGSIFFAIETSKKSTKVLTGGLSGNYFSPENVVCFLHLLHIFKCVPN